MSNEAEEAFKLGKQEFRSGNVHEALQLWYHASELGNPDAMYELGRIAYQVGEIADASSFWRRAA